MDYLLLLSVFGAAFIANFVKGVSGFGTAVVFVPIASFFLAPTAVIPLSVAIALCMNVYMTLHLNSIHLAWKNKALALGLPLGAVAGAYSFSLMPRSFLRYFIAAILLLVATQELLRVTGLSDPPPGETDRPHWIDGLTSFSSGVSGGLFSMAGPIVVSYLRMTVKRHRLRQLVVPVFALSAAFAFGTYYLNGDLNTLRLPLFGAGLAGAVSGVIAGIPVLDHINERAFSAFVATFLIVASVGLVL